jgi:hypothetical protein
MWPVVIVGIGVFNSDSSLKTHVPLRREWLEAS